MEIDCVHFYVKNAAQIQDLLIGQMGLRDLGRNVTENTIEYLVGNAHLLFSISSPLNSTSPVAKYLQHHPSGVKGISFQVPDLAVIRQRVDRLGLEIISASNDRSNSPYLKIQGWGSIEHTFIQSSPTLTTATIDRQSLITGIDHQIGRAHV